MRPETLLQLGGVSLDPKETRRVIRCYSTILKHQLKVAVADGEHQTPPHRPQDHLARELPPLESLVPSQRWRPWRITRALTMPHPARAGKFATEPCEPPHPSSATRHGGRAQKKANPLLLGGFLQNIAPAAPSAPCAWKAFLATSNPIMLTVLHGRSQQGGVRHFTSAY
jgi:hypothetical protein